MKKLFQKLKMFFSKNAQTLPVQNKPTPTEGQIARDNGIQKSLDSANSVVKNWSDIAYGFLLGYADSHKEFMIEEVRNASVGFVPEPPSKRAWGGIAVRAAKNDIIKRRGFRNVKNAKAHCTPATLWEVV
jgi:hypothetical protein